MREYAWYSPEADVIVFQIIMEHCYIDFEWDNSDLYYFMSDRGILGTNAVCMHLTHWIPLGEV